jgi:hypothetical protein
MNPTNQRQLLGALIRAHREQYVRCSFMVNLLRSVTSCSSGLETLKGCLAILVEPMSRACNVGYISDLVPYIPKATRSIAADAEVT